MIMIMGTLLLSFTLVEFGLARYYGSTVNQVSHTTFDAALGWRLTPGTYQMKPSHSLMKHEVFINEHNLRNRPIKDPPGSDARRIMILGDSFTFAISSPSEEMFTVMLENSLNEQGRYEVINAGVPGYGTAQEMLFMKEMAAKKLVADVYVLMFFVNDVLDNLRQGEYGSAAPAQPGFELQEDGTLKLTHRPRKEHSGNFVPAPTSRFYTIELLSSRAKSFLQTKPGYVEKLRGLGIKPKLWRMPSLISGWYVDETLKPGVRLTKALIKEIRDEAQRNNAVLFVGIIPSPIQVYPAAYDQVLRASLAGNTAVDEYLKDRARPQQIVSQICGELNIPCLDLLPILNQNNSKELYIPADGHFSTEGHAVAARELGQFVIEQLGRKGK